MFSLEIYADTPAIDADPRAEVVRALLHVVEQLRDGRSTASIHDSHGQPCGWWEATHHGIAPHPDDTTRED
jgi:hypothetical protein